MTPLALTARTLPTRLTPALTLTATAPQVTLLVLAELVLVSTVPRVPMEALAALVVLATSLTHQVSKDTALTAPSCQSPSLKITRGLNLTQVPA